jgi:hypothetical protein
MKTNACTHTHTHQKKGKKIMLHVLTGEEGVRVHPLGHETDGVGARGYFVKNHRGAITLISGPLKG